MKLSCSMCVCFKLPLFWNSRGVVITWPQLSWWLILVTLSCALWRCFGNIWPEHKIFVKIRISCFWVTRSPFTQSQKIHWPGGWETFWANRGWILNYSVLTVLDLRAHLQQPGVDYLLTLSWKRLDGLLCLPSPGFTKRHQSRNWNWLSYSLIWRNLNVNTFDYNYW